MPTQTDNSCMYKIVPRKHFEGIPDEWHTMVALTNPKSQRVNHLFKCLYDDCNKVFKKSCNLRDHFRKHTGQKPYICTLCGHYFSQIANLKRHVLVLHAASSTEEQNNVLNRYY